MPIMMLTTRDKTSISAMVVKRICRCRTAECCTPAALTIKPEAENDRHPNKARLAIEGGDRLRHGNHQQS